MPALATEQEVCEDCCEEHDAGTLCQRELCSDCDDWHERDVWGDITCPGWYCEDCYDGHPYGTDCPTPYCSDCGDNHAPGNCSCCSCEAPRRVFTVPNDGQPPLGNDERATVHLAAGVISDEGMREISHYLNMRSHEAYSAGDLDRYVAMNGLAYDIYELGGQWQTKQGNFTKRLSRLAYQKRGLKIEPEVLSWVGNVARAHSSAADFDIDVTRDLNQPADYFYHEDSCWWGSYSESRCALKSNGGFGLRSFEDGYYGSHVNGRAWVMPLRREGSQLVPTFNTETPDALVVFNGYGALSGYAPARVMAAMYGWTYAKISFECDPMYVNAGGYLVGPEDIVAATKLLYLSVGQHSNLNEKEMTHAA